MSTVSLTTFEFSYAVQCALHRAMESERSGGRDALYPKTWVENLTTHIYGACGELAVAKHLNIYCPLHVNSFKIPDLIHEGREFEVRHRVSHTHDLIIRPGDAVGRCYVLTTGTPPEIRVHGYFYTAEGSLREEWKKDFGGYGKPAYFIPASELKELSSHYV